jgi:hypothetical protein
LVATIRSDLLVGELPGRPTSPQPALLMLTSMRLSSANERSTTARTGRVSDVQRLGAE